MVYKEDYMNNESEVYKIDPGVYESTLYRTNTSNLGLYDSAFTAQVDSTGGRVDTSATVWKSNALYGASYKNNTLAKINRQKSIVDVDPRYTHKDSTGRVSKKFFRSSDLYIAPSTGDKSFYASIVDPKNSSYTSQVKRDAGRGTPIRLPNLPRVGGFNSLGSSAADGYITCMTKDNKIANGGKVLLASSPQNIQDNLSVAMATDTAIGSSQGFTLYSNTDTRTVSFSFDVYADYLPSPYNNVRDYCLALKQMNYPTYSGSIINSPDVIFVYGGIRIRGIPQITFTYSNTTKKGIIDKASVSVQITETEAIVDGIAKI